jgi:cytochrome bd ubiquinol oxidase subunit I
MSPALAVATSTTAQAMYGRVLMGDSLGFHIIFALFGVGIPLLIALAHAIAYFKKDNDFLLMARRWSFPLGLLFVTGAASGIIISLQLNLVWPAFMSFAGQVISLPFFFETFAFFIEAIFLGIYIYGWDKLSKGAHLLATLPLVIGSTASAFFITSANAFMNDPSGVTVTRDASGTLIASAIHPWQAMFGPALFHEAVHSIISYYLTTALVFAGIYAWHLWKMKRTMHATRERYIKKALMFTGIVGFIMAIGIIISGDDSGKYLASNQPIKFAAAEGIFHDTTHAPLIIGGHADDADDRMQGGIEVPDALSELSYGRADASVKGLEDYDHSLWPPLYVHDAFDTMVVIGFLIFGIPCVFLILVWLRKRSAYSSVMLWAIMISGALAIVAVECGWILTEVGRQPYIIKGIMTTAEAFNPDPSLNVFAYLFPSAYLALFVLTIWILVRHVRRNPLPL